MILLFSVESPTFPVDRRFYYGLVESLRNKTIIFARIRQTAFIGSVKEKKVSDLSEFWGEEKHGFIAGVRLRGIIM